MSLFQIRKNMLVMAYPMEIILNFFECVLMDIHLLERAQKSFFLLYLNVNLK